MTSLMKSEGTGIALRKCMRISSKSLRGALILFFVAGCTESVGLPPDTIVDGDEAASFISHVAGESNGNGSRESDDDLNAGTAEPAAPEDAGSEGDAARAIAEADIIQLDGDNLYALSQYAGMTVVDISNPRSLKVRGRYRTSATPFEMYLEDDVAYVMFNGYWSYVEDGDGYGSWQSTARMQAIDVSNPGNVHVIGDFEVPGTISDSRKVGDVIYLVTYQNGYCWRCDDTASTRITSFNAGDPTRFTQVDQLSFVVEEEGWGGRSIEVNDRRMYVAGPRWSWDEDGGSTIQVVDISDAGGDLRLGAEIPIAGGIENRWQMSEYEGVFRVISQDGGWGSSVAPVVETFSIESSDSFTALGSLLMVLPRPEDLQSVRFDGERAYAVTFQQTDPLFTIDLSDPAHPAQRGELEIPGWLYHMEPRGDRLYALGYDDWTDGRGLTVSIFDVSDMDHPAMLDRVAFGGMWAWQVEDQDRIHKAFNLMLDQGLIFVPYAGSDYEEETCNYSWGSGIQIITVEGDDLTLRGTAPQIGTARRSLYVNGALFGISDNALQSFDISDLDAPVALDKLEVARNVTGLHVVGSHILRFGNDWWTGRAIVDFVDPDDADTAEPLSELDLSTVVEDEADACNQNAYWGGSVYVHGNFAYVPRYRYHWGDESTGWRSVQTITMYVIDFTDREDPSISGSFVIRPTVSYHVDGETRYENYGEILLTDGALLVGRSRGTYRYDWRTGEREEPNYYYDIYDLEDPETPTYTERFEVPSSIAGGGWGYGPWGCYMDIGWGWWYPGYGSTNALVSGDIVASNHAVPLDDGTGRVRYYLDRLDVSDPSNPQMLTSINIPGQLVSFDADRGHLITVEDDLRDTVTASDWSDCSWRGSRTMYEYFYDEGTETYDYEHGTCRIWDRILNALVIDGDSARRVSRANLDATYNSRQVAVSDSRVFVASDERVRSTYEEPTEVDHVVISFAIEDNGQLRTMPNVMLESHTDYYWWWPNLMARGDRAFLNESNTLRVIDTTNITAPTVAEHQLAGWYCSSLQVSGDRAYCAMGMNGVAVFDL